MRLLDWGWNSQFAAAATAAKTGTPGRVLSENRGICRVIGETGEFLARPVPGCVPAPVTGDWVLCDEDGGRIFQVLPRRNRIGRKKAGREFTEQVLAANVDVMFVVTGLDGDFNVRRLERYLLLARASQAEPVLVLNKSDVCPDPMAKLAEADRLTGGLVPAVVLSALEPGGALALHRYVEPGRTAVLLGSSGAGKSTIANALLGGQIQPTHEVREDDSRGRHTTSSRHLFLLDAGWLLMDTPGLRELEPWATPEAVSEVFHDIEELATRCRFRDCRHDSEPGCAVQAALETNELAPARLASFRKLAAEMRHLERMQDPSAALELKRQWRAIHRAMRKMPDKRA